MDRNKAVDWLRTAVETTGVVANDVAADTALAEALVEARRLVLRDAARNGAHANAQAHVVLSVALGPRDNARDVAEAAAALASTGATLSVVATAAASPKSLERIQNALGLSAADVAVRQGAAPHHHLLLSRRWAAAAGPDVSAAKAAAAQQKASPDTVLPAPAHHAAPPPPVPMHTPTSHWSGRFVGDAKFMKSAQDVDLGSFALSCADATSIADVTRWPTQLRAVLFALKDKIPQILPRCSRSAQVYGISLTPKGKEVITSLLKHGFAMMLDTGVQGSGHIGVFLEPSAGGQRSRLVAHWEGA